MKVSNLVVGLAVLVDSVLSSSCENTQCPAEQYLLSKARTSGDATVLNCCESCSFIPSREWIFVDKQFTKLKNWKPDDLDDCAVACFDEPCEMLCGTTDECCLTKCKNRDHSGNTCGNNVYCLKQCLLGIDLYEQCDYENNHIACSDDDECCHKECKKKDTCDLINDINELKRRKSDCQQKSSLCRFDPLLSGGTCVIKRGSDDVCNTFGGGCIADEITLNKNLRLRKNDSKNCLVEEGRTCMKNKCNYQLKAERMGAGLQVISECVDKKKKDQCDWFDSNEEGCNNNKSQKQCLLNDGCSAAKICSTVTKEKN